MVDQIRRRVDKVGNIERGINATCIEVARRLAVKLGVRLPDLFAFEAEAADEPVVESSAKRVLLD